MPSVNLRELRDTRRLKEWLAAGKTVEVRERNRVIGILSPPHETRPNEPVEWPDFAARRKRVFGDQVIPIVDDLIAERNSRY
jgi:hypothetical protein